MTLLEPQKSLAYLIYLGYPNDTSSAFRITNRRRRDRRRQRSDRVVFQCYVFGATKCGKTALLNAFIGRYISSHHMDRLCLGLEFISTWILSLNMNYSMSLFKLRFGEKEIMFKSHFDSC